MTKSVGTRLILCLLISVHSKCSGFLVGKPCFDPLNRRGSSPFVTRMQSSAGTEMSTLTEETTWKLRFAMNNIQTTKGKRIDPLFVVDVQFLPEENFEPPQGTIRHLVSTSKEGDESGEREEQSNLGVLGIASGRWKLSEDPNDRKDGLWVWGLFKEPLYPFLLLTLDTEEVKLPGEEGDSIPPLQLFAQIGHQRDEESGAVLSPSSLNIREMETVKADLFGGATVDVYEEVSVGQLSMRPEPTK